MRRYLPLALLIACLSACSVSPETPEKAQGLKAGPDFELLNEKREKVSLQELLGRGSLILVFYRGHW